MTNAAKESPKITLESSSERNPQPTNLNSRAGLIKRLSVGKKTRERFVSSHVDKGYAYQIREMREQRDLSQTELGAMVGMNQNAIHRLESPDYGKSTITTLKRLAAAFDVALIVRFVPFSQLINWVSGAPYVDYGLSSESLAVPSFNDDVFVKEPALMEPVIQMNLHVASEIQSHNSIFGQNIVVDLSLPQTVFYGGEKFGLVSTSTAYTPPLLEKTSGIPYEFIATPKVGHPSLSTYGGDINVREHRIA
jgi:transcriptional regulator with XRE-family HTH domain